MSKEYCKVYVLDVPYAIDRPYDYFLPPDLRDKTTRGSFVTVPFGAGNRKHLALVVSLGDKPDGEGFAVKFLHPLGMKGQRNGFDHIFRCRSRCHQTINHVYI